MIITLQEFERLVPDEGMRKYLSGDIDEDSFLSEVSDFVPVYQNAINLAFIYAFSCYLDLKNNSNDKKVINLDECIKKNNSNSQRVIRTMQNIYTRYPLSSELMQFVLADIYYDFIQGENACLKKYFPNCVAAGDYWCDKGVGLIDYFAFVNENAESSRVEKGLLGEEFTLEVASKYLRLLLGFFPFIGCTSLKYDEEACWYVFKINNYMGKVFRGGIIDTFDLIRKFKANGSKFCFMSAIEHDVLRYETPRYDSFVSCPMVGVGGEGSFSKKEPGTVRSPYNLPTDYETIMSYFAVVEIEKAVEETTSGASMEQLFNINYKYMKNLALSIADVIGKKHYHCGGARLKEVFGEKFPHAFESYSPDFENWDSIVVILLIEAGPSMILREVFYALDDSGDDEIIRNLRRRFGNMLKGAIVEIENGDDFTEKAIELLGDRYISDTDNAELEKYNRELMAKAKTQIILSSMMESDKDDQSDLGVDCFHTDNIHQYIMQLEAVMSSEDKELKCELVERALSDTFRRLICFYYGIFAYGREKIKFDNLSRKKLLPPSKVKYYQDQAEEAFITEVKKRVEELKEVSSAVELIKRFVALCDECYRSEISVAHERSKQSRQLYAVLGKNSIMNRTAFDKIIDVKTAVSINKQNIDWWIETAMSLLQFLSVGSLFKKDNSPCSYNAISPMVASYNNHNDSKDGYDTATFALIFDAKEINGKGMEINMLSEFSYDISMRYYCLPNIVRSNNKWWIDPFVIKCSSFDELFF